MTIRICSACGQHIMHRGNNPGFNCYFAHTWTDLKKTKGARQLDVDWLLLVKCPHCSTLLWIEEQEKVIAITSRVPDRVLPDTDTTTNNSYKPSVRELIEFERADAHEKEQDKYKQIRAWILAWIEADRQADETVHKDEQSEIPDKFKDAKPGSEPTFIEYMDFLSAGVHDREKESYLRLHAWWAGNDPRRLGGQSIPMTPLEQANLRAFLPHLNERRSWVQLLKAEILRELGEFEEADKLLNTPNAISKECSMHIRDLNKKQSTSVAEVTSMYLNPDIKCLYFIFGLGLSILSIEPQ